MDASSSDMEIARKTWEIENDIEVIPSSDEIFRYDAQEQQALLAARKFAFAFDDYSDGSRFAEINIFVMFDRAMGKGSALLQRHSNLGIGSVENGYACPLWWFVGDHGLTFGQSRRQHNGKMHSQLHICQHSTNSFSFFS